MANKKFKWPKSPWFWIFIGWWLVIALGVFWLIYMAGSKLYGFIENQYNKKRPPDQQINSGWGKVGSGVLAIVVTFAACGSLAGDPETAENMIETAESQTTSYYDALDETIDKLPGASEVVSEPSSEPETAVSSEPTSEPQRESEPSSEPVAVPESEPKESSEPELSMTESESLQFVSCPESVSRGSTMRVKIKGTPGTQYAITVRYKSGPSKAKGLEAKTADANGEASWSWDIGINASTDYIPSITISGGGESISADFKVTE